MSVVQRVLKPVLSRYPERLVNRVLREPSGLAGQPASQGFENGIHLDFANDFHYSKKPGQDPVIDTFTNLFTLTRNSIASTFRGSNGLIQYANENQHQFTEDISNAFWTKNAATVSANSTVSPIGTLTGDTLTADAGTGTIPRFSDLAAVTLTGATYTASVHVKAGTYNFIQIYVNNQGSEWANFNLSTGSAVANGACVATIVPITGGWYRIAITYVAGGADRRPFFMLAASASATRAQTWNPAGTETSIFWGVQFATGSRLQPYLAATGAAAKYDQPRVEYDVNGNCLGLLMEGARTNSVRSSEDITNATDWTLGASTRTADQITAPDGNLTADKLKEDNTNASHRIFNSGPSSAGNVDTTNGCFSVFVKSTERTRCFLIFGEAANGTSVNNAYACFDLVTGTVLNTGVVGLGTLTVSGIQSYANGWYRIWATGAANTAATTHLCYVSLDDSTHTAPTSYVGVTGNGMYLWGAQFEAAASFPSSYIPTTTASVTRAADNASRTFGSEFSLTAGTQFFGYTPQATTNVANRGYLSYGTDAGNNRYNVRDSDTGVGVQPQLVYGTGAAVKTLLQIAPHTVGSLTKFGITYGSAGGVAALNTVTPITDATASSLSGFTAIQFGAPTAEGGWYWLKSWRYWPEQKRTDILQGYNS